MTINQASTATNETVTRITQRIIERSKETRSHYLARIEPEDQPT
ncbi:hypothetical protein [Xenorhabdus hominickii]|uniref:Phosphogluconate dehydratase n=1 Tax=Xenorhabdus hominickii TaxID=351679 RepID=A0A2G0QGL5_XENHO|nr:phosphogluconate dehydratase [Xenorhabdus hominickii]